MAKLTTAQSGAYLAALIDGEGSVTERCVYIANCDLDILRAASECLDNLAIVHSGIVTVWTRLDRQQGYRIYISGQANLAKILELVPIQATRKADTLSRGLMSYTWHMLPDRDALTALYETHTQDELARKFEVSRRSIGYWMQKLNIQARPRGRRGIPCLV